MNVLITLTEAGEDTGPFDLYSNVDNYTTCFDRNVSRSSLVNGYVSTYVPLSTSIIRVKSVGVCTNYVDITVIVPTTTTTTTLPPPTTTTTTTPAPITTTTTTTQGGGGETTTTTTTQGGGGTTTTTTTLEPPITTTTTTTSEPVTTTTTTTAGPVVNSAQFGFGGESSSDACSNYNSYNLVTLYFQDQLHDGSYLYTDYGLSSPAAQGWYAKADGAIYVQNGNTNNQKTAC